MTEQGSTHIDQQMLLHPLIRQLGELAAELTGVRLLIVYPNTAGWGQRLVGTATDPGTPFCRLVQSTKEGAKHCRMCHILMAVAACSGGTIEQHCHAGASVLVCPATADQSSDAFAVLSSCTFAGNDAWRETRARGAKLGLDTQALRKAFLGLPRLSREQRRVVEQVMRAMSSAVHEVMRRTELEAQVVELRRGGRAPLAFDQFFKDNRWARTAKRAGARGRSAPLLIQVVRELIRQRPDLPLSVKELAAAARLTPNHLTSLFRRHTGQIFTDYLTQERLSRAKKLLKDLTLSITEIAGQVGYDDPGYFARRFRQKTGLSPREWRDRASPHAFPAAGAGALSPRNATQQHS